MQQLLKKKKLEQLRKPAQDSDSLLELADEVIQNEEPMDIDGVLTEEVPPKSQPRNRTSETIARLAAGATPTLFGFLFGPQQAERGMGQTQKFYAGGKPGSLVKVKGEDGQAIYETPEMAIGQEAYEKVASKKADSGSAGKTNINLVNRKSGQPTIAILDKGTGQILEASTGIPLSMQDYAPAIDTMDRYKTVDQYGTESVASLPKFGEETQVKKTGLAEGIGVKPRVPEYAVKEADQVVRSYQQDTKPLAQLDRTIKGAYANLNAANTDSIAQAAGMFQTAKAVAQERMTDADREAVANEASVFARLQGEFSKAISNQQKESVVSQMKGILSRMEAINNKALAEYQDRTIQGFAGNDINKAKLISERIVMPTGGIVGNKPQYTPEQIKALPRAQKIKLLKEQKGR